MFRDFLTPRQQAIRTTADRKGGTKSKKKRRLFSRFETSRAMQNVDDRELIEGKNFRKKILKPEMINSLTGRQNIDGI